MPPVGTAVDSRHPGKVRPSTEPTSQKFWETRKRLMGTHMSRFSVAPFMTFCQKVKAMYGLLACLWDHLLLDHKRSQSLWLGKLKEQTEFFVLTAALVLRMEQECEIGSRRGNRKWARRPQEPGCCSVGKEELVCVCVCGVSAEADEVCAGLRRPVSGQGPRLFSRWQF